MTRPLTPAETANGTDPLEDLWVPVLLRALAALIFGAVTIFWATPSLEVLAWAGGTYALATGVLVLWGIPKTGFRRDTASAKLLWGAGSILTGAGVALLLLHGDLLFGVIAALGLGFAGVIELVCGLRNRGSHPLARDWIASGAIGLGTAAALPFFISLGAHALLGVAGGGAIIAGVLWVLSALTLRHDARAAVVKP
ncbi:MAG TPA: hypothetical protein VJ617_19835 [Arthrobacter sp.]|nr:hypothetical protein [Arthrobacter sp.]